MSSLFTARNALLHVLYNRGILNSMIGVEAIRTAMKKFGNKPMTGEQVRWGFENLDITADRLKQLGFEHIDDASDGSEALAKMRTKKYGLVISDWNMEPMTGYDLLKEVRADPNLATTPFIMITAESKTENVIAAKKAGVNNYIVKPFNAATLKTKIEAVFPDHVAA